MRTLITGGTGFIGSRLALKLLERGDFVRVIGQVNNEAERENRWAIENAGAEVCLASVTSKSDMMDLVDEIDLVFHLAAAQHEMNVPDQHFWDVNVTGTQNMLEASEAAGVRRFIYGSTIGVYGTGTEGQLNEQTLIEPDNIYGITKASAEDAVRSQKDMIPVVIIRISETYGPGDRRLLKLFRTIEKNTFFMIGNGKNLHHLIYVDDLISGLLLAATGNQAAGKTFVLAGKEAITTDEMVNTIAKEVGGKIRFRAPLLPFLAAATVMETAMRPLGIQPPLHRRRMDFFRKNFNFSLDSAEQVLGFSPQYTFERGVAVTAAWYREMKYL